MTKKRLESELAKRTEMIRDLRRQRDGLLETLARLERQLRRLESVQTPYERQWAIKMARTNANREAKKRKS